MAYFDGLRRISVQRWFFDDSISSEIVIFSFLLGLMAYRRLYHILNFFKPNWITYVFGSADLELSLLVL